MARSLILALPIVLIGCSAEGGMADATAPVDTDPLVGTWTVRARVPASVVVTLTVNPDNTFDFVEQVAPPSTPVGSVPDGCITTHRFSATYVDTAMAGANTLRWTFAGGTANEVTGCNTASDDDPGTPMTDDAVTSYIAQGQVPPRAVAYTVTSTTLTLNPTVRDAVGLSNSTTLEKTPE
jgi:hypothetical protein